MTTSASGAVEPRRLILLASAAIILSIGAAPREPTIGAWAAIVALVLTGTALFMCGRGGEAQPGSRTALIVLLAGIGLETLVVLSTPPVREPYFIISLGIAAALGAVAVVNPRLRTAGVLLAVIVQVVAMSAMVASTLPRSNDVFFFHQLSAQALLEGQDPYGLQFPNIYGLGTPLYAPELQEGDHVTFGYPYPPLSLLLAIPGYLIGGDYRFAAVVAVGLTALFAYFVRPSALTAGVAILIMLSPLAGRVLYWGWTESFVGLGLAVTAFSLVRVPRLIPVVLGLFLAIKQYLVPVWILALILIRRTRPAEWRFTATVSAVVALATAFPFLLWGPREFIFDVVILQVLQPFRIDSASIPGLIARAGGPQLPEWVALAAAVAAFALVVWRGVRTSAAFAASSAFVMLAFFLLSKQAFMNYYYLVFILLAFSVALHSARGRTRTEAG